MSDSAQSPPPKGCCTPAANRGGCSPVSEHPELGRSPNAGSRVGMVEVPGGPFLMGAEGPECWVADGEGPVREVTLSPFRIDRTCVTNAQFGEFIEATGYATEAERFGWSFVFYNQIPKSHRKQMQFDTVLGLQWWAKVEKADWRKPGGPGTNIRKKAEHPVVHVSWNDASAYAAWAGKRLPSEAEWERAARGGLVQKRYAWGDELTPDGKHRCNIWQGRFPDEDTGEDGWIGTAPARSFRANEFGLYNVAGNVWEWCADWFSPSWHLTESDATRNDPRGPENGQSRVIRGGSFLCHESYCNRYRVGARTANTPDSSTCHQGFRCAMDA
ncbi:MAG: formylglycine-generating enzyme family protein [Verrucomicrobiae bacterium]|nr:formylglycine-generating enzyme family protein [Verrucomicrobiae bacterium]